MTEEIIVDGVNVAGCDRHCSDNHNVPNRCYSDINESYRDCKPKEYQCNFYIKRLEQERDELKFENDRYKQLLKGCPTEDEDCGLCVIDEQNKRLKQENKELKKQIESDKGLITVGGKQQYQYLQRIDELEQENKELKERQINWYNAEAQNYRSALEEIKSIIINDNSILIDKKDYIELQCGEPIAFKLQKIYNKINEVLQ